MKADDFKSGNIQQLNRNLSFKSSVVEFGPVLEIDFFKFHPGQNNTAKAAFGTPYFMGGINIMRMNPKTRYNGEWIELQPLGTEGQGTSLTDSEKIFVKSNSNTIWYWNKSEFKSSFFIFNGVWIPQDIYRLSG